MGDHIIMNNIDKTLLLAEEFGVDVSLFTSSYLENIIKSQEYADLVVNVKHASEFELRRAVKLVNDFKEINYDIKSFDEAVILASRVNYLYSVSDEAYYINPLENYSFPIFTKSIGEVKFRIDTRDLPFQEIIDDDNLTTEQKARCIKKNCDRFSSELIAKHNFDYKRVKNNKALKHIVTVNVIGSIIAFLLGLGTFALAIYTMVSSRTIFIETWTAPNINSVYFWSIILFAIFSYLSFLFALLLLARINYFFAPVFYFGRHLKSNIIKINNDIVKRAQAMAIYLFNACVNHKHLENDISKFTIKRKNYFESKLYARCYKASFDQGIRAFKILFILCFLLAALAVGVFFIMLLLVDKRSL